MSKKKKSILSKTSEHKTKSRKGNKKTIAFLKMPTNLFVLGVELTDHFSPSPFPTLAPTDI